MSDLKQLKYNKQKLVAFNELLSKVLSAVCVMWAVIWIVASAKFVSSGNFIGLAPAFLYGSPALVWLYYRYTVYKKKNVKALIQ